MQAETPRVIPETRYAETPDGVYIAYQAAGEGPVDVAWQPDYVNNVDVVWETPVFGTLFRGIASFARLILHDRRGTGLSSRNIPPPNLETRVDDLLVVLDTLGSERPVLAGLIEGGASAALLAASNPERVQSMVWWEPVGRNVWSPDYPWGVRPEYVEIDQRQLQHWGTMEGARLWAEGEALYGRVLTEDDIRAWAKLSRHTGTSDVARELARIWYETDIRSILPSVNVPALLLDQQLTPNDVEETEYVASLMPQAELRVLPRTESMAEAATFVVDEIRK
jgi:pimeloyl-ACP methyl ester carboxylesterase